MWYLKICGLVVGTGNKNPGCFWMKKGDCKKGYEKVSGLTCPRWNIWFCAFSSLLLECWKNSEIWWPKEGPKNDTIKIKPQNQHLVGSAVARQYYVAAEKKSRKRTHPSGSRSWQLSKSDRQSELNSSFNSCQLGLLRKNEQWTAWCEFSSPPQQSWGKTSCVCFTAFFKKIFNNICFKTTATTSRLFGCYIGGFFLINNLTPWQYTTFATPPKGGIPCAKNQIL